MPSPPVEFVLNRLKNVKSTSKGWTALCPAHEDGQNSLSIGEGEHGCALLRCFAGCQTEAIVAAIDLAMADLFPKHGSMQHTSLRMIAAYDYKNRDGRLIFQVVRYEPKTFRQRRPDGSGGWIYNLKGIEHVLYRLPGLLVADPNRPVFIVEGEKDADRLVQEGLVATTNPGGAGKWRDEYSEVLRGREVVVIPDSDKPGRRHAEQVAKSLFGIARSVKVISL